MSTNSTSGITGNTQQAQAGATTTRGSAMDQRIKWSVNTALSILLIGFGVILANAGLSFAWKIIVAATMIYGGGKLAKFGFAPIKPWAGIVRGAGWIVLAVVLLLSGIGQLATRTIDKIDMAAAEGNFTSTQSSPGGCENLGGIFRETGTIFTLRKGCTIHLDAVLMKHGVDEGIYVLSRNEAWLDERKAEEFVKESKYFWQDGRWMVKVVPNDDAFGNHDSVSMIAYSVKIKK